MGSRLLYRVDPNERIPYRVFYHVTAKKNLKSILKVGIKRSRSRNSISPKDIERLRISEKRKRELYDRWKYNNFVYLTDKRGAGVIAKYWITCNKNPVILRLKIPENWLEYFNGVGYDYSNINPVALEWTVSRVIPPEYITEVYKFEGC